MPKVHFLNVGRGDCSIIQHGSGRVSMIDICKGKSATQKMIEAAFAPPISTPSGLFGDFGMREQPTEPISYVKGLGISNIFRFILTHPDMDHMDGFKALCDEIGITNFWDSGVRKPKPDFAVGPYQEQDWDHYVKVRDKQAGVNVVTPRAGGRFQFANSGEPNDRGDGLSIVAPSAALVAAANIDGDANDGSYVLVYRACGSKIVFPGDAHDLTWEYVLVNHADLVKDCTVLIAPHHGRHSDRCFDFLDVLNPKLTLFGCADSEHLAYGAWNSRNLLKITNNQAGNVVLDATAAGIDVYVENLTFAQNWNSFDGSLRNDGCYFIGRVSAPQLV